MNPLPATASSARRLLACVLVAASAILSGCAVGPDRRDPLENFNRNVTQFNEGVDAVVLKPVATAYRNTLPPLVRTGVSNFFGNLGDAWSAVNSLAQLKLQNAAENALRFGFNTVFGLGGLLDIAGEAGVERHREDFGQTLGRWGMPTGPYLVLPLLGPSTLRDTLALPIDYRGDPVRYVHSGNVRTGLQGIRIVDVRANLLRASSVLDEVALDKYTFTRDAHLQRRRADVFEGRREEESAPGAAPDVPSAPGAGPAAPVTPGAAPAAGAAPGAAPAR